MHIKIGTRGSKLALAQTNWVRERLSAAHPEHTFEVVVIKTKGDLVQDRPLSQVGGKGVFVKEVEEALLEGRVDLGVHSMKDMPPQPEAGLAFSKIWPREDPRDVLVLKSARGLDDLPAGAVLATGSKRRAFGILSVRPDIRIVGIRGNVDTRLKKMREGEIDGLVAAAAGFKRLGLASEITEYLDPSVVVPAPAQGALALEARASDRELLSLLDSLSDPAADLITRTERIYLEAVDGSCRLPVGAYCALAGENLSLTVLLGDEEGERVVKFTRTAPKEDYERLAREAAREARQKLEEENDGQ